MVICLIASEKFTSALCVDWSSDNLNSEDSDALLEVTVDEGFDYVSDLLLLNDDNFKVSLLLSIILLPALNQNWL